MSLPRYKATCTKNEQIAHDVYEIHFTKPDGFMFKAGQYVMIDCPLVGHPDDIQARAYSIASSPEEEKLIFVIKLVENGRMSTFITKKLHEETEMAFMGPLGIFTLEKSEGKDCLFVCTATGNAPFRSMLLSAFSHNDQRKMDLIFGVRHAEDLFWVSAFEEMAKQHANFNFHAILSKPHESWSGHRGHVQDFIKDVVPDVSERCVYICGNPSMTSQVKKLCMEEWGMEKKSVRVEEYV
jgi:NAD(P)H-flavin reductase